MWRVGNLVGKTLKVDMYTLKGQEDQALIERGRFACICVEANLSKQLIPRVMIRWRVHPMQYEGFYLICFICGRFGHQKELCSSMIIHLANQNNHSNENDEVPSEDQRKKSRVVSKGKKTNLEVRLMSKLSLKRRTLLTRCYCSDKFGKWGCKIRNLHNYT